MSGERGHGDLVEADPEPRFAIDSRAGNSGTGRRVRPAAGELAMSGLASRCVDLGPEIEVDAMAVGTATGMLWHRAGLTMAGVGQAVRVPIERPHGASAAQAALAALVGPDPSASGGASAVPAGGPGSGVVAFGALPFDRDEPGEFVVPAATVVESGSERWIIATGCSVDEAIDMVQGAWADRVAPSEPTRFEVESPVPPEVWRDDVVAPTRDAIRAGEVGKVVLARELIVTADRDLDIAEILRRLVPKYPTAYVFAIDGLVGASPELLVERVGEIVHAHPLAGTVPRSTDPEVDAARAAELATSAKNGIEHRITIDWLLDTLLPFCSYVDAEPEPAVVSLANVHHLGTRVEGRLSTPAASVLELVAALHPTPAVGGDPQADALARIGAIEPGDRRRYAGPVGWVDGAGNGEFAVGLRTAMIEGSTASVWAGVGVVGDSDPQAELDETRAKFEAMLGAIVRP